MDQRQRLDYLIAWLVADERRHGGLSGGAPRLPEDEERLFALYRSLVNVRAPRPVDEGYLRVEDAFLRERLRQRGVVTLEEARRAIPEGAPEGVLVWQGDITRLATDAVVNAANSALLGCFAPCHGCIDNAIHTAAGVRLRLACDELMRAQGHAEPTGRAKTTPAYNLPASRVLHTVGPIVEGPRPTARDRELLAGCYRSCLEEAAREGLASVAFCCISTGEFRFPRREAARVAVDEVMAWRDRARRAGREVPTVVFDVFCDEDRDLYAEMLR